MPRSNSERLQRIYDSFWREGQWDFSALGEDFEWIVPGVIGGELHGAEAVQEFFRDWLESWEAHDIAYDFTEIDENRVLAESRMRARGRSSGAEVEMEIAQLWTFREGRPVRMELSQDPGEMRAALGLPVGR